MAYSVNCAGGGKHSGKQGVAHCKRETKAKRRECRKRDQLLKGWVHCGSVMSPVWEGVPSPERAL
jgi:hypothetical protein